MNSPRTQGDRARTGVTFAALFIPLALITACGAGESTPENPAASASNTPGTPGTPATPGTTSTALTTAQLDKLSLAASDLKGFAVREPDPAEVLTREDLRPGEKDCVPVSQAMWGVALGDPAATVQRRVTSELDDAVIDAADSEEELDAALTVLRTTVTLASYPGEKQAKAAFTSLSEAIGTCDGGFRSSAFGEQDPGKVSADTAPDTGDESVAFTATLGEDGGLQGPTKAVVFRHGSTLAQFTTENVNATVSPDDWDFPTALVKAQATKLG